MKYEQWNFSRRDTGQWEALTAAGLPRLAAMVLCARGVDTPEKARAFLEDDAILLHDPFLLKDMDRAVERIRLALRRGERIAVYGDYDVDGITATALLSHFLSQEGGEVIPYIPDRIEEGYGLNTGALDILKGKGVSLVITVDCGITAVEETAYGKTLGMDLVITDHHECKEVLPAAAAVVDPHRPDCDYPFPHLAGVGVALKLVLALSPPESWEERLAAYADLAAIGTVADVMRLTGENRALVRQGLALLDPPQRPGLAALLRHGGGEGRPITSSTISFTLAPRINAAGRMGCAHVALDLLSTVDSLRAEVLAVSLCELNRQRQEVEADIFEQCLHLLAPVPPEERRAIVLAGEDWHQGVVGIVASRLSERYCAPTFMISLREGKGKGSCRSFGGFNLFHALEQTRHLLLGFGGHELAAGFTILEENIPAFCLEMNRLVEEYSHGQPLPSVLEVDAEVDHPALLTQEEIQALQVLEPFGMGNPKPVFALSGVTVLSMSDVGSGRHLKLRLQRDGHALDAIFFSATCGQSGLFPGDTADVAFYPQINEYRGIRSVQLLVTDLRPSLARIRQEQALFDRFRGGEDITREEAASLLPRREEFVSLWRYLSAGPAQMEETLASLAKNIARQTGRQETYMRTMVCLEVFDERGLIRLDSGGDRLRITVCAPGEKVDLEQSAWMLRLKELTGR